MAEVFDRRKMAEFLRIWRDYDSLKNRVKPFEFFDHGLTSEHPLVQAGVERLLGEARSFLPRSRLNLAGYRDTLLTVSCNLLFAHSIHEIFKVAYSRDQKHYTAMNCYYPHDISFERTKTVIKALLEQAYATNTPGSYPRNTRGKTIPGTRSRLRITTKMLKVFDGFSPEMLTVREMTNSVRLKDKTKQYIKYNETPETMAMRANIAHINATLEAARIELPAGLLAPEDTARKALYRVFNNSSFEQGGRFYGVWWQNIKKALRKQITINGEETTELDYSGFHPRMLYRLENLEAPDDDLYETEVTKGVEGSREVAKVIFLVALNAKNMRAAIKEGKAELKERGIEVDEPELFIKSLIDSLVRKHKPIRRYLFSGVGIKLQNHDATLAERVLLRLSEAGIPALPIHDSFIVQKRYEAALRAAMAEEYRTMFGDEPVIK